MAAFVDEDEDDDAEEKDVEDDPASPVTVVAVAAAAAAAAAVGVDNEVESVNPPLPLDPLIDALSHRDPLLRSSRSIPDDDAGGVTAVAAITSCKQKTTNYVSPTITNCSDLIALLLPQKKMADLQK